MNGMVLIMRNEVGWALNRLIEHPPTSLIDHSDPEMVHRFTEVSSAYLHQGFELKSVEGTFAQEITRQVDTVKHIDHFFMAALLMRVATEGLNTALRLTLADKKSVEPGQSKPKPTLEQLRNDCSLTYEALAEKTGKLDEKTVRGHCHGKPMHPSTKKLYLEVFSRLLKRDLSNSDIEWAPTWPPKEITKSPLNTRLKPA